MLVICANRKVHGWRCIDSFHFFFLNGRVSSLKSRYTDNYHPQSSLSLKFARERWNSVVASNSRCRARNAYGRDELDTEASEDDVVNEEHALDVVVSAAAAAVPLCDFENAR